MTFNVGSPGELDRIESVLRGRASLPPANRSPAHQNWYSEESRQLPSVFVSYADDEPLGTEYYQALAGLIYSLDT